MTNSPNHHNIDRELALGLCIATGTAVCAVIAWRLAAGYLLGNAMAIATLVILYAGAED
jgi:hypothetical protein